MIVYCNGKVVDDLFQNVCEVCNYLEIINFDLIIGFYILLKVFFDDIIVWLKLFFMLEVEELFSYYEGKDGFNYYIFLL